MKHTHMLQTLVLVIVAAVVCGSLSSCAMFGFGSKPAPEIAQPQPVTAKDFESDLQKIVRNGIDAANKSNDEQKSRIIRKTPYFYKQYDVYPDGSDGFKMVIQEKERKGSPYVADVTIPKQRFATRLHRKRAEAEGDVDFLRDMGTETVTYEVRNGRWVRVSSLFVADKSEEKINGEWVPVKETVKRTVPAEEDKSKGFLRRTWSSIFGG
jgi:hypothetical protein